VRITLCSDEPYPVHATVRVWLEEHGHEVVPFGAIATGAETAWALAAESAPVNIARRVQRLDRKHGLVDLVEDRLFGSGAHGLPCQI
jgi:hypothetical protein